MSPATEQKMRLQVFHTPGLGDNSYLLCSGDEAVIVDPQRDVGRFLSAARARRVNVRYAVETHVHNDYVSGSLEVSAATGAEVVAPAKGNYSFEHRAVREGDELRIGGLRLVAIETPGHTPEHVSYMVYADGDAPIAVFTGGSLLAGAAGRTDLLGAEIADVLARAQFRSLRRLAALGDTVQVLPTHGAGSFCSSGSASRSSTSTIAEERTGNPALLAPDERGFVTQHLEGLSAYPTYYRQMAPINRGGPPILRQPPTVAAIGPDEVASVVREGASLVDGRDRLAFARAHLPKSVNIELAPDFGTYVGWVVPFDSPVVLILPAPERDSSEEASTQLMRVGYDRIHGYLEGGVEAWRSSGRDVRSYPTRRWTNCATSTVAGRHHLSSTSGSTPNGRPGIFPAAGM